MTFEIAYYYRKTIVAIFIVITVLILGYSFSVSAQDKPSSESSDTTQTADIQNAACEGANLKFTSDPASNVCETSGVQASDKINNLIREVINTFSAIVGIVAVIMIIFGGFRYITSGGDSSNVTTAKNTILYAIIGLIVVALSQFIVKFVLGKAVDIAG